MHASEAGAVSILDLLLKAQTNKVLDINLQDKIGQSALFLAARGGHITIVQMLLQRKDIDANTADEVMVFSHDVMNTFWSFTLLNVVGPD